MKINKKPFKQFNFVVLFHNIVKAKENSISMSNKRNAFAEQVLIADIIGRSKGVLSEGDVVTLLKNHNHKIDKKFAADVQLLVNQRSKESVLNYVKSQLSSLGVERDDEEIETLFKQCAASPFEMILRGVESKNECEKNAEEILKEQTSTVIEQIKADMAGKKAE